MSLIGFCLKLFLFPGLVPIGEWNIQVHLLKNFIFCTNIRIS